MTTRPATRLTPGVLQRGLRAWIRSHDAHVRAAVLLLIEHEHWLHDRDFRTAVTVSPAGVSADGEVRAAQAWISWAAASEVLARSKCSSTEGAVLDLAIALATDRYRFSRMGAANSSAIARAVVAAAGVALDPAVVLA